ncbi:MAG TPA: aminopeptidase N [Ramlibacter sp.]|nr:aminopeptidase N [Ramlibacter sp.]
MREGQTNVIMRADYKPPAYWIDSVELTFDLDPAKTRVLNRMKMRRNAQAQPQALSLDGEELNLARVLVNGQGTSFKLENNQLVLENLPEGTEPFDLEIFTTCAPVKNTKLSGLYTSNDSFFTQCEAEGFRRITYFLDRPDVMASYTVILRADKDKFPVLLSNGNLVDQGDLADGRHFAKWVDPHKKPSYLFALVAGQLVAREQRITSRAGKEHLLQVYVRPGDLDKTEHAMNALMKSVAWDEARFGLSLDLERFMIVATSDFNMGAMENKGLNIFNTKYVLASQATATDTDFFNIESVVGHEYFHNWTGNRVTCRDWFQLSLKEGLTVFRDQEFSQDLAGEASARAVRRIEDVRVLRTAQFPEDAGPMAHPVRPDQYLEINNFYTVTVYEKGAEVVRMQQTLVGREGFRKGMDLYFQRFDGQAVTCDDFAQAIADANPGSKLQQNLEQFKRWYSQSGTPRVKARGEWDATSGIYKLTLSQHCPPTPGQAIKQPFVIPISLGLVSQDGQELASGMHVLTEESETLTFPGLQSEPVPSLLRGFSAPVVLECDYSDDQLLTLLQHDTDAFNRWEAGQRLALNRALSFLKEPGLTKNDVRLDARFIEAMRAILRSPKLDAAFKDLVLTLPAESYIAEQLDVVDPQQVHAVREGMREQLALTLQGDWEWVYEENSDTGAYVPEPEAAGRRSLAGLALLNLCVASRKNGDTVWPGKTLQRFKDASNMTDRFNALAALVIAGHELAAPALERFHAMFKDEALVIDKWFALQAGAPDRGGNVLGIVKQLMQHPDFNLRNPNRARALIFSYCNANPGAFHRADAAGYVFWCERVLELDAMNPQVASRLARALDRWKMLAEPLRGAAREAIARVAAKAELSNDVREVVSRALAD